MTSYDKTSYYLKKSGVRLTILSHKIKKKKKRQKLFQFSCSVHIAFFKNLALFSSFVHHICRRDCRTFVCSVISFRFVFNFNSIWPETSRYLYWTSCFNKICIKERDNGCLLSFDHRKLSVIYLFSIYFFFCLTCQ